MPSQLVWSNFSESWNKLPFAQFYINSFAIAIIAVVVTVFINLLCGYTFAKYRFWGRDVLFLLLISTLMIPIQVIMVPEFLCRQARVGQHLLGGHLSRGRRRRSASSWSANSWSASRTSL